MSLGEQAERAAEVWLKQNKKYAPHAQNVRCPGGEVDLVMKDGDVFVFIEVKARTNNAFGTGLESITKRKLERMMRVVEWYLTRHFTSFPEYRLEAVVIENGQLEHYIDLGFD